MCCLYRGTCIVGSGGACDPRGGAGQGAVGVGVECSRPARADKVYFARQYDSIRPRGW